MSLNNPDRFDSKQQLWRNRIADFYRSNPRLSVAQFCHASGLSVASFYQWKRKLQHVASDKNPLSTRAALDAGLSVPAFLRIDTTPPQATVIELRLPTGISILVPLAAIDSLRSIVAHLTIQQSQVG